MFLYSFDHDVGLYEFNYSFKPTRLQIGDAPIYNLIRPFGSREIFQTKDIVISASTFVLFGYFAKGEEDAEQKVEDLRGYIESAVKLYSTDVDKLNKAYVDVEGTSELEMLPETPYAIPVSVEFFPSENTWRLDSDDSAVVI